MGSQQHKQNGKATTLSSLERETVRSKLVVTSDRVMIAYPRQRPVAASTACMDSYSSASGTQCGGYLKRATSSSSTWHRVDSDRRRHKRRRSTPCLARRDSLRLATSARLRSGRTWPCCSCSSSVRVAGRYRVAPHRITWKLKKIVFLSVFGCILRRLCRGIAPASRRRPGARQPLRRCSDRDTRTGQT